MLDGGISRVRRRDLLTLGSAVLAIRGLSTATARASSYPDRPVRLIIPFPPGGGFDAIGRPWADRIKPLLGTIVVENQGGGGSSLGARHGRAFQS
jgi:tripartite-type tricarboxylate transporter receptor subunit TctC